MFLGSFNKSRGYVLITFSICNWFFKDINKKSLNVLSFHDRCPLGSGRHRDKILLAWLICPLFPIDQLELRRDIVVKGDELQEVKTVKKTNLELGWVMPHSAFGATLNPDPSKNFTPHPNFFSDTPNFSTKWSFGITPNEHLWFKSRLFSGRVSRFAEFFMTILDLPFL